MYTVLDLWHKYLNRYRRVNALRLSAQQRFKRTAKELSDYILALPLTNEQNDKLIELIMNHVLLVEREAMVAGNERCERYR